MKKTMRIDQHYEVTIPTYISYDTDFVPYDGVAYIVTCESEDNRFFDESVASAVALLKGVPGVTNAEYLDDGYLDSEDVDYDPSIPMWTEYMSEKWLRSEREDQLRGRLEEAVDARDFDEIVRLAAELQKLCTE